MSMLHTMLAQATTPTTTQPPGATHLTGSDKGWTLALVAGFVLLAGLVIIIGRSVLASAKPSTTPQGTEGGEQPDRTLLRSWLAISLVGGLLIFCALSFWIDDETLRSTLIGGLIANAGAAVAFYFASKSSDQARQDILSASLPWALVPDLVGKSLAKVHEALATTALRLDARPANPKDAAQVISQYPAANQSAAPGSAIAATFAIPTPDLTGLTSSAAQTALTAVGLQLIPTPAAPAPTDVVTRQSPATGEPAPDDGRITATFAPPPAS
jgi:hypothetical protein